MNNIGTAVLAKSLDNIKQSGEGMIDMMNRSIMERSVNPNLCSNIDTMV